VQEERRGAGGFRGFCRRLWGAFEAALGMISLEAHPRNIAPIMSTIGRSRGSACLVWLRASSPRLAGVTPARSGGFPGDRASLTWAALTSGLLCLVRKRLVGSSAAPFVFQGTRDTSRSRPGGRLLP